MYHVEQHPAVPRGRNQQSQEGSILEMTGSRNQRYFRIHTPWLTIATLLLFVMVLPAWGQHVAPELNHHAPNFALPDLNGKMVSLSDYKGKVVLVNFWATWCPPCRLEMPTMEEAYRTYKAKGFEVIAVSVDAGPKSAVQQFLQEFDLSFTVLLDPQMETLRTFRSFSLPTSVVIDRQGVIRLRELGYRDWTDPESTKLITGLLGEQSS
ncbi:MAG: TlpA family protein disulfide reductase [candidate division NC10 bacterium]|nr:TlpA family protein disulfide reductase [candidate division NC10 bacterium]